MGWKEKITSMQFDKVLRCISFAIGEDLVVSSIGEVTGDALIVYKRGAPCFLFDLEFKIEITRNAPDGTKYTMKVSEFTNDNLNFRTEMSAPSAVADIVTSQLVPRLKIEVEKIVLEYKDKS